MTYSTGQMRSVVAALKEQHEAWLDRVSIHGARITYADLMQHLHTVRALRFEPFAERCTSCHLLLEHVGLLRQMEFAKWVDTHVHYLRAPRLQAIMTLLEHVGPLTCYDVQERIASASRPARMHASARMRVSIDTIQRDLKLLTDQRYVQCTYPPLESARYGLPASTL